MKHLPEVFTIEELRERTGESPLHLAVLGDPVAHSASPQMHMAALREYSMPFVYGRILVKPHQLPEAMDLLRKFAFVGANLTIPHKTAVLPLVDSVSDHARCMGAANTLNLQTGRIEGFNTDGPGLARAVTEAFGVQLGRLRVMIVGAGGGAGRAVALQCALEGCPSITLVNRTHSKANELAEEIRKLPRGDSHQIRVEVPEHTAICDHSATTELVLQCSSVGMKDGDPSPLPPDFLHRGQLVYDTIYSRRTQLISDALKAGARTADGRGMLLHQGALAFEIWFGKPAPIEAMRAALG